MGHRSTCRVPRTALATLSTWSLMIFLLCLQMRKLEWTENDVVSPTRVKFTEGKLVIGKWRGTRPRKQDEAIRKWKKGGEKEKWLQLPLSQNFGASACVFWELEPILWPSAQVILKHPMFLLLTQAEMRHQAATFQPPVIWFAYMCAVVLPLRTKNVSILWAEVHGVSALFFVLLREAIKLPIWGPLASSLKALSQMDLHLAGHPRQTDDIHTPRPSAHFAITLSCCLG